MSTYTKFEAVPAERFVALVALCLTAQSIQSLAKSARAPRVRYSSSLYCVRSRPIHRARDESASRRGANSRDERRQRKLSRKFPDEVSFASFPPHSSLSLYSPFAPPATHPYSPRYHPGITFQNDSDDFDRTKSTINREMALARTSPLPLDPAQREVSNSFVQQEIAACSIH